MPLEQLHRFECDEKRFVIDPETCFCFECDEISWDVLEFYPHTPVNRIHHILGGKHDRVELDEVIGELEWLRVTKSILTPPSQEEQLKLLEVERGLKRLSIRLPGDASRQTQPKRGWFGQSAAGSSADFREIARAGIVLLLSRSGTQKDLRLEFVAEEQLRNPEFIEELSKYATRTAELSGKSLTVAVSLTGLSPSRRPDTLEDHALGVTLEFEDVSDMAQHLGGLAKAAAGTLPRLAKMIQSAPSGVNGRIVVQPNHPGFGGVVHELDQAGFDIIELDLDSAFVSNPGLDPQAMMEGLRESAVHYAKRLLERHYFRLDPIAPLFVRIYQGSPLRRADPAGTNELAVDEDGAIYPSRRMLGWEEFRLGTVTGGGIDEEMVLRFDDVGSVTTAECIRCWARNLCGGGCAAVHHALSGSFRRPHRSWCDAHRSWMASAVSAFNLLSSEGVNFERVYRTLGRKEKPSLFALARAALTPTIGVRPIEEADAEMLTKWENWNEAAYFLFNQSGLLLATRYDREMDSLHPRGTEHELMLIRKDGAPFGLFKVRPERISGAAQAWLYMHDEADYAAEPVRKGFRAILEQASGRHALRRLTIPVSPREEGLRGFLEALGFTKEGVLREALYLHGEYHDVTIYGIALGMGDLT